MLKGKHVLLGVTGGIASYKIATLTSLLVKAGADVHVIMTKNATNFINPITFETLTGHKCITDTFDRNFEFKVEHVALAQLADIVMIAPATANVMAKLAHGLADDMLTTTVLASRAPKIIAPAMNTAMYENPVTQDNIELLKHYGMEVITPASGHLACGDSGAGKMPEPETDDMLTTTVLASRAPKIIAPAMNTAMYENPVTQDNIELLKHYGMEVITPASGHLACGDSGAGKMPEPETLFQYICKTIAHEKDMAGMKVLVTAGPTQEAIDPVRYITNHSSGKMGYSIAKACMLRGADVTLVTGRTALDAPLFVNTVPVISAKDMYEEVTSRSHDMDIIIKAAAVADYRPCNVADEKIKKKEGDVMSIPLERTDDILKYLGEHKERC